jgi:pyruvate dehydrogenase E2 component (dihydrolipoamide acetyltransferase)
VPPAQEERSHDTIAPSGVIEGQRSSAPPATGERRLATPFERTVARRLVAAKQAIPHFYVLAEADATRLLALREELNGQSDRPRISVNTLIVAAVGRALRAMPEIDAVWEDESIVTLGRSDVGIAIDTPRGLLAPLLRDVGAAGLDGIAAAAASLVERARAGRLEEADFLGGAVSVSNVGMVGVSHLIPIIPPGQAAILGVGAVKSVFRPDASGAPSLRQEIGLTLSCDHRVLDGMRAARFLDRIVHLLEHPLAILRG